MGYLSYVSVVFYSRDVEQLPLAALKLWFDENYPVKEAMTEWGTSIKTGDDYILVTYQDVKWYNGYPHVIAVDAARASFADTFEADEALVEDAATAAYEFVRIGEDIDDVEESRSGWADYRLGVKREVIFE